MIPLFCILIHSGAPSYTKLFDNILKELKRRRIIKKRDIIYFDRGYYSYKNYQIGINKYKIVPAIFPKQSFSFKKLEGQMSYPLEVFNKNKHSKHLKNMIKSITNKLYDLLKNCKRLKTNTWTNRRLLQSSEKYIWIGPIPQLHNRINVQKHLPLPLINSTSHTTRL